MRIAQFGAGTLGQRVLNQLSHDQHQIDVYRQSSAPAKGAEYIQACDVTQPFELSRAPYDAAVVILAPNSLSIDDYQQVYRDAIGHIIEALVKHSPKLKRFVVVSSTRVLPKHSHEWLDEDSQTQAWDKKAGLLIEMEKRVERSPFSSSIIRLTGLYGASERMIRQARSIKQPSDWPTCRWTNRIHIDDAANLVAYASTHSDVSGIIHGVDQCCVTNHEVIRYIAEQEGFELPNLPDDLSRATVGKRVRSRHFPEKCPLAYPSYREGYAK